MAKSAQLRTGQLVLTRLGRLKPYENITSRNRVLLQTQIRQKKTVDNVLRLEMHVHDFIDGNVQIVIDLEIIRRAKLSIGPRINDLPVELFGGHLHLKIGRRGMGFDSPP